MSKSILQLKKDKVYSFIKKKGLKKINYLTIENVLKKNNMYNNQFDHLCECIINSRTNIYIMNSDVVTILHEISGHLIFDRSFYTLTSSSGDNNRLTYLGSRNVVQDMDFLYDITQDYFDSNHTSLTNWLNKNRIYLEIIGFIITSCIAYYVGTINCK